jgi:hypothetical protein
LFDVLAAGSVHSHHVRHVAQGVCDERHLDIQLGPVRVGAAHPAVQISFLGLGPDLHRIAVPVQEALDIARHDRLEAPEGHLLDQTPDHPVLVAVATGVNLASLVCQLHQVRAEDQVNLGIHENEVLVVLECGHGEPAGFGDGACRLDQHIHALKSGENLSIRAHGHVAGGHDPLRLVLALGEATRSALRLGEPHCFACIQIRDRIASNPRRNLSLIEQALAHGSHAHDCNFD